LDHATSVPKIRKKAMERKFQFLIWRPGWQFDSDPPFLLSDIDFFPPCLKRLPSYSSSKLFKKKSGKRKAIWTRSTNDVLGKPSKGCDFFLWESVSSFHIPMWDVPVYEALLVFCSYSLFGCFVFSSEILS